MSTKTDLADRLEAICNGRGVPTFKMKQVRDIVAELRSGGTARQEKMSYDRQETGGADRQAGDTGTDEPAE